MFAMHPNEWCLGTKQRAFKKLSRASCEAHCNTASCACYQYKDVVVEGNCRIVLPHEFVETRKSKVGFHAYVREGAVPPLSASLAKSRSVPSVCGAGSGAALKPGAQRTIPPFFVYPLAEPSLGQLSACYAEQKKGAWPWGSGQPGHVSTGLWLSMALLHHTARVSRPEEAAVLLVPAAGALSEAVGFCGGTTHYQRMFKAADMLRASDEFRRRPHRHVVIASADTPRNLLGELGSLAAARGALAACLDGRNCGAFRAGHVLAAPWVPHEELLRTQTRRAVDAEACGDAARGGGVVGDGKRPLLIFFRGSLGRSREEQAVRIRIALLRAIGGAEVRLVGDDPVQPGTVRESAWGCWLRTALASVA